MTQENIEQSEILWGTHFGKNLFNAVGWKHILDKHDGHLPLSIKAIPEGSIVPTRNVLLTIENTDPAVPWLTNYVESLLVQVWYPITVCTLSHEIKKVICSYLIETGDDALISFKLHDFGFRGVSSLESAEIGGAAHLVNFKGTDNIAGAKMAMNYYKTQMPGISIPAAEHSTITSWGSEHEVDAYENMIQTFGDGLFACVSDSYDIYKACSEIWGGKLKDKILNMKGNLVIRPDSGNPLEVILKCLDILGEKFGFEKNAKGYKVLHPKVRLIQGDGVNLESIQEILGEMKKHGWSADNIAFGMGGSLLQKINRDTQKFAFKCSAIEINGEWKNVYKDPITAAWKKSKKGRLKLVEGKTISIDQLGKDELVEVFRDGKLTKEYTFEEIRNVSAFPENPKR